MSFKKKYRYLAGLCVCLVLLAAFGWVYAHGEWWFPLLEQLRTRKAPDLTEVTLSNNTVEWSLSELTECENVRLSATLMLINSEHPIPADYEADLIEYNGAKMHPLMLDPYIEMRDDVLAKTGIRIYVSSDYRTSEEQATINAESESGIAAEVGCSEHEAGLALDVYAPYGGGMGFLRSGAGREVNRTCSEYGYIIRYPKDKQQVTGISYEPWHLRYVGQPHARIMAESGLAFEEYVELLMPDTWYRSGDYLIARLSPDALILPADFTHCDISPDNTGYYIVTLTL